MSLRLLISTLAALVGSFAMIGCTGPASGPTMTASTSHDPVGDLFVGMLPHEVRAALGDPVHIESSRASSGVQETWTYERSRQSVTTQVAATTKVEPYIDPINGALIMLNVPDQSLETTTMIEELHLFWGRDQLVGWRTVFRRTRDLQ